MRRRLRPRRRRTFRRRIARLVAHGEVDTEDEDIIEAWEAGGADEPKK